MTGIVRHGGRVVLLAFVLSALTFPFVVRAEASSISGPVVSVDRTDVSPGERLVVTIDGFTARAVTIATCGNEARRGSSDCNMIESKGVRVGEADTPTVTQIGVFAPPVGCPCVIRVSSQNNDEVAVAPINLIGHPIGPVVGGPRLDDPLVAVSISARATPHGLMGWVGANLGGRVSYEVTVTVTNLTTEPLHQLELFGSVGRSDEDQLATFALEDSIEIGPGQTWKQVVPAEVPAPSVSSIEWQVVASRAGPTIIATSTTRHRPVLLVILAMVLVVDLSVLVIRYRMRRRADRELAGDGELSEGPIGRQAAARRAFATRR